MRHLQIGLALCFALTILVGLTGCDSTNGLDINAPETLAEVQSGALAATLAAPSSDIVGDLIVDMMSSIDPAPPAAAGAPRGQEPVCPASFDLGNGITGTCSASPSGVVTFAFGGSVPLEGVSATVDGTLVASPAASQPTSGSAFTIDFDAIASSPLGDATWSSLGAVTRDDEGQPVDYTFNMTHIVTPAGGQSASVTTVLTPSRFELLVSGPLGGTLRFLLDRETMGGIILLNGVEVAAVSIVDGCVSIDFLGTGLTDEIICPQD